MLEVFALFLGPFFHHNFIAKLNTFVAYVDAGSGNQFFDFFLTFPAKRTAVVSGGRTFLCHKALSKGGLGWGAHPIRISFSFCSCRLIELLPDC